MKSGAVWQSSKLGKRSLPSLKKSSEDKYVLDERRRFVKVDGGKPKAKAQAKARQRQTIHLSPLSQTMSMLEVPGPPRRATTLKHLTSGTKSCDTSPELLERSLDRGIVSNRLPPLPGERSLPSSPVMSRRSFGDGRDHLRTNGLPGEILAKLHHHEQRQHATIERVVENWGDGEAKKLESVEPYTLSSIAKIISANCSVKGSSKHAVAIELNSHSCFVVAGPNFRMEQIQWYGHKSLSSKASPGVVIAERGAVIRNCTFKVPVKVVADADFKNCRFLGSPTYGVKVIGRASVSFKDCNFESNKGLGCTLGESARVSVVDCEVKGNGKGGFGAQDSSAVTIAESKLWQNALAGVIASGLAQVFCSNSIANNNNDGVLTWAGGTVQLNQCEISNNKANGITALGSSQITVNNSVIEANRSEGVNMSGKSILRCQNSLVRGNGSHGIDAQELSSIALGECSLEDNKGTGVMLSATSRSVATGCVITGNKMLGARLETTSTVKPHAVWRNNIIEKNGVEQGLDELLLTLAGDSTAETMMYNLHEHAGLSASKLAATEDRPVLTKKQGSFTHMSHDFVDYSVLRELQGKTKFRDQDIVSLYQRYEIMRTIDPATGEIGLTLEAFIGMFDGETVEGNALLSRIFQVADDNGNGLMDFEEFVVTLDTLKNSSMHEMLDYFFQLCDTNSKGYLTPLDWEWLAENQLDDNFGRYLRLVYNRFDVDGDEQLTLEEIRSTEAFDARRMLFAVIQSLMEDSIIILGVNFDSYDENKPLNPARGGWAKLDRAVKRIVALRRLCTEYRRRTESHRSMPHKTAVECLVNNLRNAAKESLQKDSHIDREEAGDVVPGEMTPMRQRRMSRTFSRRLSRRMSARSITELPHMKALLELAANDPEPTQRSQRRSSIISNSSSHSERSHGSKQKESSAAMILASSGMDAIIEDEED